MDGGKQFRDQRIFGPHKTWRGLLAGMAVGTLVFWVQQLLAAHTGWAHTITRGVDYANLPTLLLGPLFGLGALGGDAIESFFKRQKGIASGDTWLFFDQLDYIIGSVLVSLPFVLLTASQYIWIFVLWFGLHIAATYIGWRLGLKNSPI